jgi:hypothetical protein
MKRKKPDHHKQGKKREAAGKQPQNVDEARSEFYGMNIEVSRTRSFLIRQDHGLAASARSKD